MITRNKIPASIQEKVRLRANYLCEYCHASERWQYVQFTVDHVVPVARDGSDSLDNLALACFQCNRRKSDKLFVMDPESEEEVSLFNPRQDEWQAHFVWSFDWITLWGLTALGRATILALDLNRERILRIRTADAEVNRHPPTDDPIAKEE